MRTPRPAFLTPAALAVGAALGVWLWKRWGHAVHEIERDVVHSPDPPVRATPDTPGRRDIQREEEGEGPRFHRRYVVDVADPTLSPEALLREIGADIQAFVPGEIATFHKTVGAEGRLAEGDEFDITITSPWNGPVRVVEVGPTRFTLATLDGHLEAGQIRFEAGESPRQPGALRFSIESWARSRDGVVDFVYDGLGIAKEAQRGMWTFFCKRVAEAAGGEQIGEIRVLTEREREAGEDG